MGLQTPDQNKTNETAAPAPSKPAQGKSASAPTGLDAVLRRNTAMRRVSTAESLRSYATAIRAQLEGAIEDKKLLGNVRVIELDKANLYYNAVLVAYKHGENVFYHTLLVECSGVPIAAAVINQGGRQVSQIRVPGDVYSRVFVETADDEIINLYGKVRPVATGCLVITSELSSADANRMYSLAFTALTAAFRIAHSHDADAVVTSVSSIASSETMVAELNYDGDVVESSNASISRAPIQVVTKIVPKGVDTRSMELNQASSTPLTRVGGYIDLAYHAPEQVAVPYGYQPQVDSRIYYPRMIITAVESEVSTDELELQLLAISTSTILQANNCWMHYFRPRMTKGVDLHDIGAVGYEAQIPDASGKVELGKFDTKSADFGDAQFYELISKSIFPTLVYTMDVDETGDTTWLQDSFVAAALGNTSAANAVLEAADRLTDGHFSRIWNGANPMIAGCDRIHLGHYVDEHGERRDIRDLDYLAILNLMGEQDMQVVTDYMITFEDVTGIDELTRLDQRADLIRKLLGDTVRFTGYASRVNFNPEFIKALSAALASAGLEIRPENIRQAQTAVVRGIQGVADWAVKGYNTNLFAQHHGHGARQAPNMGHTRPYGGWSSR